MEINTTIYHGRRGNEFKQLITGLLKKGKVKDKYLDILVSDTNMTLYSQAFTASTADPENNYEFYEQLGDVTANKFIVWYMSRRFPQLKCPLGVKVVARLKINYGARQTFSTIAENLGFWPFISAMEDARSRRKKDLLEDCFESFVGITESILDDQYRQGVGNAIVYDILKAVFDELPISLQYNDLYDAKTRFKELMDCYPDLGNWKFRDAREDQFSTSELFIHGAGKSSCVGLGRASKKSDSQQKASEEGLRTLNRRGYMKTLPEEYAKFAKMGELF